MDAERLGDLIERPELVLHGDQQKDIHQMALRYCTDLFASLQKGKSRKLLVKGFTLEQIWEQLDVHNDSFLKIKCGQVKKMVDAHQENNIKIFEKPEEDEPEQEVENEEQEDVSDDLEETPELSKPKRSKKAATHGLDDAFFQLDEMEDFVQDAERLDGQEGNESENEIDYFNNISDNEETKAKFDDFFDAVSDEERPVQDIEEAEVEEIGVAAEDAMEELDQSDEELDRLLDDFIDHVESGEESTEDESNAPFQVPNRKLTKSETAKMERLKCEAENPELMQEEDDEQKEDELDAVMAEYEDSDAIQEESEEDQPKSISALQKSLQSMEEKIEAMEQEQLDQKHWSMTGEASAADRPLNSLIETHVDLPMSHFAEKKAMDSALASGLQDDEDDNITQPKVDIEKIILQRIKDQLFDDVVPKAAPPPAKQEEKEDPTAGIDTTKSKIGLGEIYAQQYEKEVLGNNHDAEENKEKAEMKEKFSKLMYELDMLSNNHFTPRPIASYKSSKSDAGAITMEETIPLMMSTAGRASAAEVRKAQKSDQTRDEMDPEARTALRRANKKRRVKDMKRRLESGEMTLQGKKERDEKLREKNKEEKKRKADDRAGIDKKKAKKKMRSTELLANAGNAIFADTEKKEQKAASKLKL